MKSVCFVSTLAYPMFEQSVSESAGGAEKQQKLLAEELVKRGYIVSFVVGDYGQGNVESINGIKFFKCGTVRGKNSLWNFPKSYLSLARAMRSADADVYLQRTNPFYTGQVAFWCKLNRKRFVYFTGHDSNCDPDTLTDSNNPFVPYIYKLGLNAADKIVVQSDKQKKLLSENFGRSSEVIRSLFPEYPKSEQDDSRERNKVIFVGSLNKKKRPEIFIELASHFPGLPFELIGSGEDRFVDELKSEAAGLSNLTFRGTLRGEELSESYKSAIALVLTSSGEGFPNVFLEAWNYGTPVLSLGIDPDNLLSVKGAGIVAASFEELIRSLKEMRRSDELKDSLVRAGKGVLAEQFNYDDTIEKLTGVIYG